MVAAFDDPTAPNDQDLVGVDDRRKTVGDHQGRSAGPHLAQGGLDGGLRGTVKRAGRLVEHQQSRIGQQRARQTHPLPLARPTA